ncbi:terminase small subunit [Patescibacteria group bacterium]|nr:terminase small subunit [Patescibacteria group bacterium]MBU1449071.1 terminase small subunit [Patescibacteria group bacterium]
MPKRTVETPLTGKTKDGHILSEKEELFCNLYVQTFNKLEAIIEAYKIDKSKTGWYQTVRNMAHENLTKPYINTRIRELLDKHHLNDEEVDLESAHVIRQNAEYNAKNSAIREYNLIKGRHADKAIELKFKGKSDDELENRIAELFGRIIGDTGGVGEEEKG